MFGIASASNLNSMFGSPSVQPVSEITQTSNWFGDTFVQPWVDMGGTLASAGKSVIEETAASLPSYFLQKWGVIPQAGQTGGTTIPQAQPSGITDKMPDWARDLLAAPGAAYTQARDGGPINLGILAVGLVLVFFLVRKR